MKLVILILVALVATFLPFASGAAPQCGPGGAPDATRPSMCNCYSGFAPTTKASVDCNVNPGCPPIEKGDDSVGEYGANRPITSFAADRLNLYQTLPIVDRRLGATIRLVAPVGIPGVTPGTPGASTCGYPGVLWNKTVNDLSCNDEFRGSMPWNSHAQCGFVLDTTNSNNSTAIYKATLVTQYNETFIFNGKEQLRMHSNAYSISVSFLKQKQISNLLVNVTMKSPVLTIDVIGDVLFDSFTGTTSLTLRTSASWPYKIDASSIAFSSFVSSLVGGAAPTGVTAAIAEDTTAGLICNSGASSVCRQQWLITIIRGSVENCDIGGDYTFASTLLCRDGAPCGGAPSGSFAFNLLPTDFCYTGDVDATADSVYILKAYQDNEHLFPAAQFGLGTYVYFGLTVIDPAATLKGITFSDISVVSGNGRDVIYSTVAGVSSVAGVHLVTQEVNRIVSPGTPADLTFSFQLLGKLLVNSLGKVTPGGDLVPVSVQATINLVYYGDNRKREAKIAMELSQGSASTTINVVPAVTDEELSSNSPVYTTSLFTILALLSFVLLF